MLPIGFLDRPSAITVKTSPFQQNLLEYLRSLKSQPSDPAKGDFYVSLEVTFDIRKSGIDALEKVQVVQDDPDATKITLTDEVLLDKYPWSYHNLCDELHRRYTDFSVNWRFYDIKKQAENNESFAWVRYLNPDKPKGMRKVFYSRNIVQEFDKHYTRR